MSTKLNIDAMSLDEMWGLHESLIEVLSARLTSEKRELETKLAKLRRDDRLPGSKADGDGTKPERRKFAKVSPKYRNPDQPSETWSGRGKRPRWLTAALTNGRTIEDFVISDVDAANDAAGRRRA